MRHLQKAVLSVFIVAFAALPAMAATRMIPATFSELAEMAKPGVVNIQTSKTIQGGGRVFRHFFGSPFGGREGFEDFFNQFGGQPQSRKEQSLGSGFIISKDGYIVTNNHVIKDADKVKVILHDNSEYDAKVIGNDPMTDLALIKIKAKDLKPLKFGKSSDAKVGSWVVAIGSPFGLEQTVTAGIISAKGRIIGSGPYDDFIQTDASINPGNSGGPLLNMEGEVIGINTAIIRSGQGIGFAIPSDMAVGIIDQLTENQQVSRGWMGVAIQPITKELADYYGVEEKTGVLVAKVFEGDPADKAGIKPGDVVIEINGKTIENPRDLTVTIANLKVQETVKVVVVRDGKEKTFKVKLGKRPSDDGQALATGQVYDTFGFKYKAMDPALANRLGYPKDTRGLVVVEIKQGSQADRSGVRAGDLLVEMNRQKITTAEEYAKLLNRIESGDTARMLYRRGNQVFAIRFEKP
ncbi:MAG: Do family serine endopeptidase [Desulfobacterales bacterium]|nr:Do family serine endopeptidase [Desulfobacterales bacterium]